MKPTTIWVAVFASLVALSGCTGGNGNDHEGVPDAGDGQSNDGDGGIVTCTGTEDCPQGMECRGGVCEAVVSCACNYDCGARGGGRSCDRGLSRCVDGTAADTTCSTGCDCYAGESCSGGQCVPMGGDEKTCDSDADCEENETCQSHRCVRSSCTTREDCEGPVCLVCVNGACTAPPSVCQTLDDCCVGFHCNFGVCVPDNQGCQSDAECTEDPTRPRCVDGECMPECLSDLDCLNGQKCVNQSCENPGCTIDTCDPGQWCDPTGNDGFGACVPGCDQHSDCTNGQLCDYDTHVCVADCCGGCPGDQVCNQTSCTCEARCASDTDCEAGETCNQSTGECETQGGGELSPCAADTDCATGLLCDTCAICTDPPAYNQCLYECSMSVPCPRADLECSWVRKWPIAGICIPLTP